jgi:hypothetical protein
MSDTQRWTQPGWDGLPGTKSKKHQARDKSTRKQVLCFTALGKNTLYNLRRKIDSLRLREAQEGNNA